MIKKKKDKEFLEFKSELKQLKKNNYKIQSRKLKCIKNIRINKSNYILKNVGKCFSLKKKFIFNRVKVNIIEVKVEGNVKLEFIVEVLKREIREYNESI